MKPTGVDAPTTAPGKPPIVDDDADDKPAAYENPDLVARLVRRCIDDAANNPARLERDMSDIYNLKFYRGGAANQWIYRPRTSSQWEERPFDGDDGFPAWFPRCVTNDFANRIDGIVSIFAQSDPAKIVTPATDDDEDVAAADVAQRGIPVLEDEIGWTEHKRDIAHLCSLTNGIALVLYYDNDPKHGTDELPVYQCPTCAQNREHETGGLIEPVDVDDEGACPDCGDPNIAPAMNPEQMGAPLTLRYARGKLCADLVNSFGYSLPRGATTHDAQKNPWVLLHNKFEVDTAVSLWPRHAEKIRAAADRAGKINISSQLADELRNLSSPTSTAAATGGASGKGGPILIYRLQHDPITDGDLQFPDGLYAVMLDDIVLEAGPLPIVDSRTGRRRKSILTHTFKAMPGSPFGKPPADDLAPVQVQLNWLESLAFLTTMHHASPTVFIPDTLTLIDELTGRPGQVHRFRDPSGTGKGPITQQGSGVHPTVFQQMDRYEAKMDKLSGLNAVLQGARPDSKGGDPTLGEIQILQERGMASFKTPLDGFVDFQRELTILELDIARQSMWSPRFRKIKGDNGQWEVEQFLGTDLTGHVDITIDPMSAWPKSPMMQDLRLAKAIEFGIIAPAQDPEAAGKALEDWGLADFKKSLSVDRKQIARELDRWRAAVSPAEIEMPDLEAIELGIHLFVKRNFLKSEQAEEIKTANPPVYDAIKAHVRVLMQAMAPPPAPAAPAGPDHGAVDAAVKSGALVPEGAGGDPLEAALSSGALQPEGAMPQGPTGPSMDQLLEAQLLTPAPAEAPAS